MAASDEHNTHFILFAHNLAGNCCMDGLLNVSSCLVDVNGMWRWRRGLVRGVMCKYCELVKLEVNKEGFSVYVCVFFYVVICPVFIEYSKAAFLRGEIDLDYEQRS